MPKAVSFAAVLDPALLLKDATNEKRSGKGKKEKVSTSHNSSDGQSGRISTNDSTTEEIIARISRNRKGKARARDDDNDADLISGSVNHRRTSAKLRMALAGESPILQRSGSIPVHVADTSADITESIYDFTTTNERRRPLARSTSAPSAILPPSSSSSGKLSSLAHSLASEEAKKRKNAEEHAKRKWDEVKRRTLYGSERRKLERQSRRMARNPKAKMMQNMGETIIGSPSDLHRKEITIVPVLSQNDLELFKEDKEPATFSQQSNFSVESDDGVYHTQFSFFQFDEEGAQSMQANTQKAIEKNTLYSESLDSSGVQTQTQAAYFADRSASCSLSDPQSNTTINHKDITSSSPSQQVISTSDSVMHELVQSDQLLNHNEAPQQCQASEAPNTTLVEQEDLFENLNDADRRRLRTLCLDENVQEHKVRRVRPTIWQGQKVVKGMSPLSTPPACKSLTPSHILQNILVHSFTLSFLAEIHLPVLTYVDGQNGWIRNPIINPNQALLQTCMITKEPYPIFPTGQSNRTNVL